MLCATRAAPQAGHGELCGAHRDSVDLCAWPWLLLPIHVWVNEQNTDAYPSRTSHISALKRAFTSMGCVRAGWIVADRVIRLSGVCLCFVDSQRGYSYIHTRGYVWRWRCCPEIRFGSGSCYAGESGSHGDLECLKMRNHASSRCSEISRFLWAPCPLLQSSITSLRPRPYPASSFNHGSEFTPWPGIVFKLLLCPCWQSHLPAFALNIDYKPEKADKWHTAKSAVSLQQ